VLVCKQGLDGNKWDAKLVEAMGKSQELFEGEIAQLDREIATLLLGQSQSTDGQAGLGARAVHRLDDDRFGQGCWAGKLIVAVP
jgi:hypothetical protein